MFLQYKNEFGASLNTRPILASTVYSLDLMEILGLEHESPSTSGLKISYRMGRCLAFGLQ
jgi:hypothetical protein